MPDSSAERHIYNFGAGPAMLPRAVMLQAREEFLDWRGCGISVIEMSHRSAAFKDIAERSIEDLTDILKLPKNYQILFLQGGATHMMSMVPLNLCRKKNKADYVLTGSWSKKAYKEARRHLDARIAASSEAKGFMGIPHPAEWRLSDGAAYLYFCDNETISGVEFESAPALPDNVTLISDMTSNFLSRPLAVNEYGVIFAGAQKNVGPAGLTFAIIREDFIHPAREGIPFLYDFQIQAEHNSMFNTPPTFNWYMAGLTFSWIKAQGGLEKMHERAVARSAMLYDFIDSNGFYTNPVDRRCRSRMNVPFMLADSGLEGAFLSEAKDVGLLELKGHRSVGGMRASLYNAMPLAGVKTLVEFMADFARRYG